MRAVRTTQRWLVVEFEAPVDAWYVWLGVVIVSGALVGVALSLPSQPPPDATEAANAIDRVAGSTHVAEARYEHDADEVRVDGAQIAMRNDGGTDRASVAFGPLTPISALTAVNETERPNRDAEYAALEAVLHGEHPTQVVEGFDGVESKTQLYDAARDARLALEAADDRPAWRAADGTLSVRRVEIDGRRVVLIDL